ncbi:MAG: GNAT family N-acetyltransferase, partial [Planctomycetota bacterium]
MLVVRHEHADAFLHRAGPWLEAAEAENHLILGIAANLKGDPHTFGEADPFLLTVEGEGGVAAAALMTPPFKLLFTRAPDAAIRALAEFLFRNGAPVPGVLSHPKEAETFARLWGERTGKRIRPGMAQRAHACDRVIPPAYSPGALREARKEDAPLMLTWKQGFLRDVNHPEPDLFTQRRLEGMIARKQLHIWEDGRPVSMAGWADATPNGVRISTVYTPPEFRNRGYATSATASLTERLLQSGRKHCFLYTDLGNPTSNKIYRSIGYRPVADNR